jgi:hypothetical protein
MSRVGSIAGLAWACWAAAAWANHAVIVEGNNVTDGAPGSTSTATGTGGDYDGDGRVGTAEDTDNSTDRVFGTITAALLAANGGANANGAVTIVTSGRFGELVRLPNPEAGQPALNGVVVLEAAPGVRADLDAVVAGLAGNDARTMQPGIVVDTPDTDRIVVLRNLSVRNFAVGLDVRGNARVVVENCRFDGNLEANVRVSGSARLTMVGSTVAAGGMRFGTGGAAPAPGDGIVFHDAASGTITHSTIAQNSAAGIRNVGTGSVRSHFNTVADNAIDLAGTIDVQPGPVTPPVLDATVGPCKRCKTRGGTTTCTKCAIAVTP